MAKVTLVFALLLAVLGLAGVPGDGESASHGADSDVDWAGAGLVWVSGYQPQRGPSQAFHARQRDDCAAGLDRDVRRDYSQSTIAAHALGKSPDPIAMYSKQALALILIIYVLLCIRSFVAARRSGRFNRWARCGMGWAEWADRAPSGRHGPAGRAVGQICPKRSRT